MARLPYNIDGFYSNYMMIEVILNYILAVKIKIIRALSTEHEDALVMYIVLFLTDSVLKGYIGLNIFLLYKIQ